MMKHGAVKVRRIYHDKVVIGFAGSVADAFTLCEHFEGKLQQYSGNLYRAAVELAQMWRGDKTLRQLEAMMIVADDTGMLVLSGTGEVIEPDDGVAAIGSGGTYALSAARALVRFTDKPGGRDRPSGVKDRGRDLCLYQRSYYRGRGIERGEGLYAAAAYSAGDHCGT